MDQARLEERLFNDILALVNVNTFPGRFINIDTLDGGGNSTQTKLLASYLQEVAGIPTVLTREPTDEEYGLAIRRVLRKKRSLMPIALQMLFAVDRADHLENLITPALAGGTWVLTARYALSQLAFGMANGLSAWQLLAANISYLWPNLNIVLMVPVEECLRRIDLRNRRSSDKRELFEVQETLERTLEAYRFLATRIPCVELVDGTGTETEVFERVRSTVEVLTPTS